MTSSWVVTVEGNLVCAIEPATVRADAAAGGTPLEVACALAGNFARQGCIDGSYAFADRDGARVFAALCLRFSQALVERRLSIIDRLPLEFDRYHADEQPQPSPPD
jgi:hypothetical protein